MQTETMRLARRLCGFFVLLSTFVDVFARPNENFDALGTLRRICCPKSKFLIYFSDVDQVREVIYEYKKTPEECSPETKAAWDALEELLDEELMSDVCGLEMYEQIRRFHLEFVSRYVPEAEKKELSWRWREKRTKTGESRGLAPIPESLRRFFILFVLQISLMCKRDLEDRLDYLSSVNKVSDRDFRIISETKAKGLKVLGLNYNQESTKFSELKIGSESRLHVEALKKLKGENGNKELWKTQGVEEDREVATKEEQPGDKLYVQTRFGAPLKKFKDVCEIKFKPIYDELFAPSIRLNNLGYSDRLVLSREDRLWEKRTEFTRWFPVIENCEVFRYIEIVQDSSSLSVIADLVQTETSKMNPSRQKENADISFLDMETAQRLKAQVAKKVESEGRVFDEFEVEERSIVEHSAVGFNSRLWIIDNSDGSREIKEFESNLGRLIRNRLNPINVLAHGTSLRLRSLIYRFRTKFPRKQVGSAAKTIMTFVNKHSRTFQLAFTILGIILIALQLTG